jgi:hypothetical protein
VQMHSIAAHFWLSSLVTHVSDVGVASLEQRLAGAVGDRTLPLESTANLQLRADAHALDLSPVMLPYSLWVCH